MVIEIHTLAIQRFGLKITNFEFAKALLDYYKQGGINFIAEIFMEMLRGSVLPDGIVNINQRPVITKPAKVKTPKPPKEKTDSDKPAKKPKAPKIIDPNAPPKPPRAPKIIDPNAPPKPPRAPKIIDPNAPPKPPKAPKIIDPNAPPKPPKAPKIIDPNAPPKPPKAPKVPKASKSANLTSENSTSDANLSLEIGQSNSEITALNSNETNIKVKKKRSKSASGKAGLKSSSDELFPWFPINPFVTRNVRKMMATFKEYFHLFFDLFIF